MHVRISYSEVSEIDGQLFASVLYYTEEDGSTVVGVPGGLLRPRRGPGMPGVADMAIDAVGMPNFVWATHANGETPAQLASTIYYKRDTGGSATRPIVQATYDFSGFVKHAGSIVMHPRIALGPDGTVYVAYIRERAAGPFFGPDLYTEQLLANWETVDTNGGASVADGRANFSDVRGYLEGVNQGSTFTMSEFNQLDRNGDGWLVVHELQSNLGNVAVSIEMVTSADDYASTTTLLPEGEIPETTATLLSPLDIAIDKGGDWHLVFMSSFGTTPRILYRNATLSESAVVYRGIGFSSAVVGIFTPALAIDTADNLHVAWTQLESDRDSRLIFSAAAELRQQFDVVDVSPADGQISLAEALVQVSFLTQAYFDAMDANSDGGLSRVELDLVIFQGFLTPSIQVAIGNDTGVFGAPATLVGAEDLGNDLGAVLAMPNLIYDRDGNWHLAYVKANVTNVPGIEEELKGFSGQTTSVMYVNGQTQSPVTIAGPLTAADTALLAPSIGLALVVGGEGEGEGEGECAPICTSNPNRDSDGDGATDCEECIAGTDPNNPDTDGDGMADGYEIEHGLNPLVDDSFLDNDGDGLTNVEEFLLGSDPNDPNSPSATVFVSPDGQDTLPGGTQQAPFRTIAFALGTLSPSAQHPARIVLASGVYRGNVTLRSHVALTGGLGEAAVIEGRVTGAEHSAIENVTIMPAAGFGQTLLVDARNVRMFIRRVDFIGGSGRTETGILVEDSGPESIIEQSSFSSLRIGLDILGGIPTIRRNVFQNIAEAGIVVRASGAKNEGLSLGSETDASSGWNIFDIPSIDGFAVVNETDAVLLMENNEWGTNEAAEIDAAISGSGDFEPFLSVGSAILASSIACKVWDAETKTVVLDASVFLQPTVYTPAKSDANGVYLFAAVLGGTTYTIRAEAPRFGTAQRVVAVPAGGQVTVTIPLNQAGKGTGTGCHPGAGTGSVVAELLLLVLAAGVLLAAAVRRRGRNTL